MIPALFTIQSKAPPSSLVAVSINSSIFSFWEISNFNVFTFANLFFSSSSFSALVPEAKIFAPELFNFSIYAIGSVFLGIVLILIGYLLVNKL